MNDIQKKSVVDMLQYQEGAVVSKTLIDKKTGTVTASITAKDSGSPIIYYSYSFDGGKTYSYLLPWDRTKDTDTVSIPNPAKATSLIVRAHNQYDFFTSSSAVTIK